MVPIVMPEVLDKSESIISWILSSIEVCFDKFEESIIVNIWPKNQYLSFLKTMNYSTDG